MNDTDHIDHVDHVDAIDHNDIASDRVELVRTAARNNAEWCDAVCRAHGLAGGDFDAAAWGSAHRTPPLYPDAVTLSPTASEQDVLARVDTATPGCSVKDSFACLDLSHAGFDVLLDAHWIHRPAGRPAPAAPVGASWQLVKGPDELSEWEAVWRGDEGPNGLFRPELLADETISVLVCREDVRAGGRIVAGAIASRSASVVGLSNLFSPGMSTEDAWAGCLAAVARWWPARSVVGYEQGEDLAAAVQHGCAPIGPVRIWLAREPEA